MDDLAMLLGDRLGFDPVEKAGLSKAQEALMEPLLVTVARLKDGNGLCILYNMDHWIAAQIIAGMFNADGTSRTAAQVYEAARI